MKSLYPLKFEPILVEKVWGGKKLATLLNKDLGDSDKIGESWELSAVEGRKSVVKNGFLAGNTIEEIIEIYMGELVGDRIYMKYGIEFPLLFKFIDANDDLSVQVHPDNEVAKYRHYAYGKTEMWYVVDAEPNAKLIMGFNKAIDKQTLLDALENKRITEYLNFEDVKKGDVFYIPPGRVHALLKGIVVAEIQQTSDITYRLYDWDRLGLDGKPRDLHIDLAVDVIDYSWKNSYKKEYFTNENARNALVENPYFTTNLIKFDTEITFNYSKLESFVVYMCIDGEFDLIAENSEPVKITKGETVLVPAEFESVRLVPSKESLLLETYIPFVHLNEDEEFFANN